MIIVTGGAGFIGSNLVARLNAAGRADLLVVDDLTQGRKAANLGDCVIQDYLDRDDFIARVDAGATFAERVEAVFHLGACSDTTEWDGRYMMRVNYSCSRSLLHYSLARRIPFVYASSAAVYGGATGFRESGECERPLNVYGYSKLAFDQHVRALQGTLASPVVGLRYFNVYGPREQHKGRMASVVWHFHQQLLQGDRVRLFEGSGGYAAGEQRRDFVHVDDVVTATLWSFAAGVSGIFNVGTGRSQTFNEVARAVIDWHGRGTIEYIPFPQELAASYQSRTEADLAALRAAGYGGRFMPVEEGVCAYLDRVRES